MRFPITPPTFRITYRKSSDTYRLERKGTSYGIYGDPRDTWYSITAGCEFKSAADAEAYAKEVVQKEKDALPVLVKEFTL